MTGAVALAAGAAAGGRSAASHGLTASTMTAVSRTRCPRARSPQRVDSALVDVVSTVGDQGAGAAGTGIVLTSNGEVLTNNHVIRGATSIRVTDMGNGSTYTAKVVGYDASKDVAVIQLQNGAGLTTANLGDSSSVQSGDAVTALGNAGGKGGTPSVATGAVTALNQAITASDEGSGGNSEQLTGLIEINADIQPGDSGGALVNSSGQVIGMNTAASSGTQFQSESGQSAAQAYAIPIDNAESIAKQIEAGQGSSTIHIGATAFLGIETGGSDSARAAARVTPAGSAASARATAAASAGSATAAATAARATAAARQRHQRQRHQQRRDHRRHPVRLRGGQRRPGRGRHDHLGGRPGGLLGQRHPAGPGQVPPRRQDLGQLGGPERAVQTATVTLASGPAA